MLKIDWYLEQPLEFEYKNYILLDYIQSVDKSFQLHKLSPYLLWTEKLLNELTEFETKRKLFISNFDKSSIIIENGKISLINKSIEQPESIKIITEIIEYSSPILQSKVNMGYKLLNKYPQILY